MSQIDELEHIVYERKEPDLIEQYAGLYTEFPLVIRKRYAHCIEHQKWDREGQMNMEGQEADVGLTGESIYNELVRQINNDIDIISSSEHSSKIDVDTQVELSMAKKQLQKRFEKDTDRLLTVIQECQHKEHNLLNQYRPSGIPDNKSPTVDYCSNLNEQLQQLFKVWKEIDDLCQQAFEELKHFNERKYFLSNYAVEMRLDRNVADYALEMERNAPLVQTLDSNPVLNGQIDVIKERLLQAEREMEQCGEKFLSTRKNLLERMNCYISSLNSLSSEILAKVHEWKQQQKLAFVRAAVEPKIDILTHCCSSFGLLIYKVFEYTTSRMFYQIGTRTDATLSLSTSSSYPHPSSEESVHSIVNNVKTILEQFLQGTFVVSKQPPELLKMSSTKTSGSSREFAATVRILGAEKINIKQFSSDVQAAFSFEMDLSRRKIKTNKSENCSNKLEKNSAGFEGNAEAKFTELKVTDFLRDDSKLKVWQKRYRLVFTVDINFQATVRIHLKTMSLPFVLNTGSSQECSALGALTWYCYNCDVYDLSLNCPTEIPWSDATDMLNSCIMALGGRGLMNDEKKYLAKKMTGINVKKHPETKVSFIRFCDVTKEKSSKDGFCFFKWFQAIRNLLSDFLLEPWKDGVIKGFISRTKAGKEISSEPEGTFFLRFSETYINGDFQGVTGGIVAVIKLKDKVLLTPPRKAKQLAKHSLYTVLQQIIDTNTRERLLKNIHPSRQPFDKVFKKYNTVSGERNAANYHDAYPGWKQYLGIDLSKLHLNDPITKNDKNETETPGAPVIQNRVLTTYSQSKAKERRTIDSQGETSRNIPNFLQCNQQLPTMRGCDVVSDGQTSGGLRQPVKAGLKRRKLCGITSGGTSGGTISVNDPSLFSSTSGMPVSPFQNNSMAVPDIASSETAASPVITLEMQYLPDSLLSVQSVVPHMSNHNMFPLSSISQIPQQSLLQSSPLDRSHLSSNSEERSSLSPPTPQTQQMETMSMDSNSPNNASSVFSTGSESPPIIETFDELQSIIQWQSEQNPIFEVQFTSQESETYYNEEN